MTICRLLRKLAHIWTPAGTDGPQGPAGQRSHVERNRRAARRLVIFTHRRIDLPPQFDRVRRCLISFLPWIVLRWPWRLNSLLCQTIPIARNSPAFFLAPPWLPGR